MITGREKQIVTCVNRHSDVQWSLKWRTIFCSYTMPIYFDLAVSAIIKSNHKFSLENNN